MNFEGITLQMNRISPRISPERITQTIDGIYSANSLYRGTIYTNDEAPMKLQNITIILIVVRTKLCSPLPAAPKYCDATIAISKLSIAESKREPNVCIIFFSNFLGLICK